MIVPVSRWTAGVERRVLANGLTVLVQADPGSPAVAVITHVKAGFFDEPDRWQGISHVLEHMFFKGTPTRGVGRIASETKALGGYLNASTSYDATSYYVVLPADGFARALAIQADALRNATIDGDELARELRVIIEEAKRKLDTPSAVTYETMHELLFDHHRIRRWRIGTEAMLAEFTRDDVVGYYQSRYVPEQVIVSVVGGIESEQAFAAVERAYRDWTGRSGVIDRSPDEPWRNEVRARNLTGDVKQGELAVGWRGLPPLHPDSAALDLAAVVLGSGRGSRLYQALRQTGVVTSIAAYHYSPTEVGVFSVTADFDPARLEPALEGIASQVAGLRASGPTAAELERAATLVAAQWARRFESVEGRASAFAAAEALGGIDILDREYAELGAVTPDQVRDAARQYLRPDGVALVSYLPPGGSGVTAARLTDIFRDAVAAPAPPAQPASAPSSGAAPSSTQAARSGPAGRRTRRAGVEHVPLPGADLLVARKPGVPLVSVGIYRLRRGVERLADAGIGALAVRSAARGAGKIDAGALADRFERMGGTLGASIAADWFGFGTSVLGPRLGEAIELLETVLREPTFAAGEIERERASLAEDVAHGADDMFRYPVELALSAAFGEQRYGIPVKGTQESVARLDADQVRRWHGEEMAAGRTTVVAVGDLDVDDTLARLVERFAGLPPAEAAAADRLRIAVDRGRRVESRAKSQTALTMFFPGPGRNDPDRHAAMVLAAVASGLGGRLFHALRDRRSLAYTVIMASWQRRLAGGLLAYIATSPDREEEARTAMLEELARLAADGVTDEELEQAVNYLAGQTAVQRQTVSAVASEVLDAWLLGTGLEEMDDPSAAFRAVTAGAVREVAARAFDPDARAEAVVRGGPVD